MILAFVTVGLLTFLFEQSRLSHRKIVVNFINHCFPWVHWKSASTKIDIVLYLAGKLSQRWIAAVSAAIVIYGTTTGTRFLSETLHINHHLPSGTITIVVLSTVLFIFSDFGEFFSHLVQHKIPALWEFHKIHHSAQFLTPFTTYRFHPVGNLLDGIFMGLALIIPVCFCKLFYDLSYVDILAMSGAARLFFNYCCLSVLQHSHFQISFGILDKIFISPVMHQVHHSMKREHWGKNLGSGLSIWDWWFGTALKLPKGEVLKFGMGTIEDERGDFASIWHCYASPIVNCYRMAHAATRGWFQKKTQMIL